MAEKNSVYTIYDDNNSGSVIISNHVICTIAGLAAMEVKGIASMKGDIESSQITRFTMNALSKCVRVSVKDNAITVQMVLNIKYGYNLPEITKKVQERVRDVLENMTGLTVESVNISISDVKIEKNPRPKKTRKVVEEEE
ncbi:MAG: Asp23/Gls24 family envelope stress response protein [Candidatus Alectryocaccobium sp.]|jgi:uncharacterized alkaline shock family protein YloU|nr:Asp23/Gls24 family envelope stress response protein [Lachnospiraceae bacterium]MDY6222185.1 Asp23/Gls24 family envelope stress response protein [Candidatus Alectryocaccobium sp.]